MSKVKMTIAVSTVQNHHRPVTSQTVADDILRFLPFLSSIDSITKSPHSFLTYDEYVVVYDCPHFSVDIEMEPVYRTKCIDDGQGNLHFYIVLEELKVVSAPTTSQQAAWLLQNGYYSNVSPPTESSTKTQDTTCNHAWKWYHGLRETYEYCIHCDEKRK